MMRSAARGAAGGKEAVSAKTSAGLGKLMSALHQNAASLVNTKAEHNGPDQVLAATEYSSSLRGGAVLLRREEVRQSTAILSHVAMIPLQTGLGSEEPLSVPTLLQQVCKPLLPCVIILYWPGLRRLPRPGGAAEPATRDGGVDGDVLQTGASLLALQSHSLCCSWLARSRPPPAPS